MFEYLFQTSLKIHNLPTKNDRINLFTLSRVAMRCRRWKTSAQPDKVWEKNFSGQYVKPQSMAVAKHKVQKLVFTPGNQNLIEFFGDFQRLLTDGFKKSVHGINEQLYLPKCHHT